MKSRLFICVGGSAGLRPGAVAHASWSMVHVIAMQMFSTKSAYVILANRTRAIGKAK